MRKFTDLTATERKDLVLFIALGTLIEQQQGRVSSDFLTDAEDAAVTAKYDELTDDADIPIAMDLAKAMFREIVERILTEEAAESGES